jgi:hypothetical protein
MPEMIARHNLTDDEMVSVKAIAPFEMAAIMRAWTELWDTRPNAFARAYGPPHRLAETPDEFAARFTDAFFYLIKEV